MATIINGYILSNTSNKGAKEVHKHNSSVISRLPEIPESGEYLIRPMFSIIPLDHRLYINTYQLIQFIASYDQMYGLDKEWVIEFEILLSKLSWLQARVFHSYTGKRVDFISEDAGVFNKPNSIPTKQWEKKFYSSYYDCEEVSFDKFFNG